MDSDGLPGHPDLTNGTLRTPATAYQQRKWSSLPPEIRNKILRFVAKKKNAGWATSAATCKEFQAVIAKENFRRLKLTRHSVEGLARIICHSALVEHVWLKVELPPYRCPSCDETEIRSTELRARCIIWSAIYTLFTILSTWEPAESLKLEISVYSPSDAEHSLRNYILDCDHDDGSRLPSLTRDQILPIHDPYHGWVSGRQIIPDMLAVCRVYSQFRMCRSTDLPVVRAVTGFVIRRQVRRWCEIEYLECLFNKLPRLESIQLEVWSLKPHDCRSEYTEGVKCLMEATLPTSVKRILVFEDTDHYIAQGPRYHHYYSGPTAQFPGAPSVGRAFALRSCSLEHLSAAYIIDAKYFFREAHPLWTWNSLESLALTAELLGDEVTPESVQRLLSDAGEAALRMPRLNAMVLWNADREAACAFIYRRRHGLSSLTWRGTWRLEIGPDVTEVWEQVAAKFGYPELRTFTISVTKSTIGCHGDAIRALRLPFQVLDRISLWQKRKEELARREIR